LRSQCRGQLLAELLPRVVECRDAVVFELRSHVVVADSEPLKLVKQVL